MLPINRHPQFDEDFLKFESKVDELIKYLNDVASGKDEGEEVAAAKPKPKVPTLADAGITKDNFMVTEEVDRSFLYKKTCNEEEEDPNKPFTLDKHSFMRQLEVDAEERAEARRDRIQIAKHLKAMGNEAYRKDKFEEAIDYFSKAIDTIRDSPILYCNRALSYIKLGNYRRAVMDCDHVVNKLDEKNLRGWLYRALAYKKLDDTYNYDVSVEMAYKTNNKQREQIDEFIEKMKQE